MSRLILVLLFFYAWAAAAQQGPVIDVHLHSYTEVPPGMEAASGSGPKDAQAG